MDLIWFSILPGIANGCVYALIGIGFILIRKTSGVFNLAQGEIVIFGCYLFYSIGSGLGLNILLAIALSVAGGMVFGFLIERTLMRPLYGQPLMAAVIVTLALAMLIEGVMNIGWGGDFKASPRIFPMKPMLTIGGAILSYDQGAIIAFTGMIFGVTILFFKKSRLGIAMMAISEDQATSQSLGIKVSRLVSIAWAIACSVGFLGGILITNISGIHVSMVQVGIKAIAVAIIGGFESFAGLLIAGTMIGIIEAMGVAYIDPYVAGGSIRDITAFILMIAVLLIKPYGLFGWERIERV